MVPASGVCGVAVSTAVQTETMEGKKIKWNIWINQLGKESLETNLFSEDVDVQKQLTFIFY